MALESRVERDEQRGVITAYFRDGDQEWFAELYIDGAEALAADLMHHVLALRDRLSEEIQEAVDE